MNLLRTFKVIRQFPAAFVWKAKLMMYFFADRKITSQFDCKEIILSFVNLIKSVTFKREGKGLVNLLKGEPCCTNFLSKLTKTAKDPIIWGSQRKTHHKKTATK